MNILIFVMTFLMILATLSYSRWESFIKTISVQKSFEHYMGSTEQQAINSNADKWYAMIKIRDRESGNKEGEANSTTGRVSFHLLLKSAEREKHPQEYQMIRSILKRLLEVLYADQRFFQEMAEKRPNFLDELLEEIQNGVENKAEKSSLTHVSELLNLQFSNSDLHHVFYLMMRGLPKEEMINKEMKPSNEKIDKDSETDDAIESQEASATPGYASLMDELTLKPSNNKIRLFLASKKLLTAIYGDAHIVDAIVETRKAMYKDLKKFASSMPPGQESQAQISAHQSSLSAQFKEEFPHPEFMPILDFAISQTNPKKYE